jgi:hypothetical protein
VNLGPLSETVHKINVQKLNKKKKDTSSLESWTDQCAAKGDSFLVVQKNLIYTVLNKNMMSCVSVRHFKFVSIICGLKLLDFKVTCLLYEGASSSVVD